MAMEIKALAEALQYIQLHQHTRAIIVTDSMCTLMKVAKCFIYADWMPIINNSALERLVWIFTPGHSGVQGNERADSLAEAAIVDNNITLDAATVIQCVTEQLIRNRPQSSSQTLALLKKKGIQDGDGANSDNRGTYRRQHNQMLMGTISIHTLRSLLEGRTERLWTCASCYDVDVVNKV